MHLTKSEQNVLKILNDGMRVVDVARKINVIHNYALYLVNKLEEKGVIKTEKKKRERFIFLTKKGKKLQEVLKCL